MCGVFDDERLANPLNQCQNLPEARAARPAEASQVLQSQRVQFGKNNAMHTHLLGSDLLPPTSS